MERDQWDNGLPDGVRSTSKHVLVSPAFRYLCRRHEAEPLDTARACGSPASLAACPSAGTWSTPTWPPSAAASNARRELEA
jgi:hypothetical protein